MKDQTHSNRHPKHRAREHGSKQSLDSMRTRTFMLQGILQPGRSTKYSINGEDFEITEETWVIGELKVGKAVQVKGVLRIGQGKFASKIFTKG